MSMPGHLPPAAAPAPVQPLWQQPRTGASTASIVLAVFGIALGALLLVLLFVYFILGLGVGGVIIATVAALVPLVIVLLAVRWVDRWEPEPRSALWFAFLWGAGAAVVIALLFDLSVQIASYASGVTLQSDLTASVLQAPLVEEGAKGFGVLLILWVGRRYFDGPVDGLVYAATVAGGFAFSENILYFGSALAEGGDSFVSTFVVRGIFSPFAHVMFTSCTGLALGFASRRTGRGGAIGFYLLGLIPAAGLHALWNGAFYVVSDVVSYYLIVQVPLFLGAIALVVTLRVTERRVTRTRLAEYAEVGWFAPSEVDLLSTHTGRRQAMLWARAQPVVPGQDKVAAMKRFVRDATRLAHTRQRLVRGRAAIGSAPDELALLSAIGEDRRALLA
ncbi:PrsW family intramembrane metalloprotease [Naasia lichenicola]|uniref:PrsW family intramembrane metalloprotease n=1 Tax=Naasia lichenicola TaxID=2565933 RepID=A0A4S4FPX2_9MICO|nr:PrsW family intramembrane metalloprotease [Naasia lichenicola]THG32348.1 PrsW family intramembrane metalloprotease [Naasia lichenicola]